MIHTLEADGINLNFNLRVILSDIYLKCETGKVTGLLGRNGQGKSCLMNVILGTLKTPNNSVRFDNKPVANAYKRPELILYLPQFYFIPASLKVKKVLEDFQLETGDFQNWFPEFKLKSDSKVSELSGGQRRLLEIYTVVKANSLFAMLDEPFTHLHPIQIDKVKEFLRIAKEDKGLLITDHMFRHLLDSSDSVYLLKDGRTHLTRDESDIHALGYAKPS